jgi:hypothetical protein
MIRHSLALVIGPTTGTTGEEGGGSTTAIAVTTAEMTAAIGIGIGIVSEGERLYSNLLLYHTILFRSSIRSLLPFNLVHVHQ